MYVCPWWLAYTFDNRLRRLFHKPEEILAPYVKPGMTVMDIGCGMGFFSIGMAKLVGPAGAVLAVDLQQKMLDVLMKRAARAGMAERIRPHRCAADRLDINTPVDFVLACYMLHEVRDAHRLLEEVHACLKPGARLLVVEPKIHVSRRDFLRGVERAEAVGFRIVDKPAIRISHSILFAIQGR